LQKERHSFYAPDRRSWRNWLIKNSGKMESVWLIIYKKECAKPGIDYPEAVEEALCFGWIDSLANKRDPESYYLYFSKRKPNSNWSKLNKTRVARLIEENLMMPEGLKMVELAKKSGTWTKLEEVDQMILPDDLQHAFNQNKIAFANWNAFSDSSKRGILQWLMSAKKEETRQKRIKKTVELAAINIKANGA
jgi:uncharacterized protein YdeI (YjbR/CyaY-like superfamily)